MNCEHWKRDYPNWSDGKIGSCTMRKVVEQALGNVPQDFHYDSNEGKDIDGKPIRQGSVVIRELGVSVGAEYGEDCEYFTQKI